MVWSLGWTSADFQMRSGAALRVNSCGDFLICFRCTWRADVSGLSEEFG